jgi:hypothetical protein
VGIEKPEGEHARVGERPFDVETRGSGFAESAVDKHGDAEIDPYKKLVLLLILTNH